MKIRGDDPTSMKNFILSVQSRVNELKSASGDDQNKINGKRVSFLLVFFQVQYSMICSIFILFAFADGIHA